MLSGAATKQSEVAAQSKHPCINPTASENERLLLAGCHKSCELPKAGKKKDPTLCTSVPSVVKGFVEDSTARYSAYVGRSAGALFPASRTIFRNHRNSVRSCSMVKFNSHTAS